MLTGSKKAPFALSEGPRVGFDCAQPERATDEPITFTV